MSRARKRADRIREKIPIQQVLAGYGYPIEAGYDGEQQFPCDLHGDGIDNKPSARVYPDSNSWYCFSCDRARDAIETCREKEGKGFWDAVKTLEARYNLPRLPWDDEDHAEWESREKRRVHPISEIRAILDPNKTFEDDRKRLFRLLDGLSTDRDLPMRTLLSLWEAYDKVVYLFNKNALTEEVGRQALAKIRLRILGEPS